MIIQQTVLRTFQYYTILRTGDRGEQVLGVAVEGVSRFEELVLNNP